MRNRGFSIVFFACGCHSKAPEAVKEELESLGFPVPPVTEPWNIGFIIGFTLDMKMLSFRALGTASKH